MNVPFSYSTFLPTEPLQCLDLYARPKCASWICTPQTVKWPSCMDLYACPESFRGFGNSNLNVPKEPACLVQRVALEKFRGLCLLS